jgi:hypothetical protein
VAAGRLMRALSPDQLLALSGERLAWCAGWRQEEMWETLSVAEQKLVEHAMRNALAYRDLVMAARRNRAVRLRGTWEGRR